MENLKWQDFKQQLMSHPDLHLQFQYTADRFVAPSYHLTEIKQANITSVDCGGLMNAWTEVVLQLWEPENQQTERAMKVEKALSIIALVEKSLPIHPSAIVKIEFGNTQFDTRQMYPREFVQSNEDLIISLQPDQVQCKAIGRGDSCGPKEEAAACCAPPVAVSCAPGSGCC